MTEKKEETKKKTVKRTTKKVQKKEPVKEEIKEEVIIKEEPKEKKKTKKCKYSAIDVFLILALTLIFGVLLGRFLSEKPSKSIKELKEVDLVYNDILENHYDMIFDDEINSSLIEGLLDGLDDKYAYYNNDKAAIMNYNEEINGYFTGLGVQITTDKEGKIVVVNVFEDSPAYNAGIQKDDVIVKMDGKLYTSGNFNQLTYLIKSSNIGDEKEFEILREDDTFTIKVKLEKIDAASVTYSIEESNGSKVGVIKIENFSNNTYDQFVKAYEALKEENISSLILDLRYNYEGTLENASKIASLFLVKGATIYYINDGDGYDEVVSKNDKMITLPVTVVIDGTTVSTAEMIAAALRDNAGAKLVGTTTYGKGYMQKIIKLANGRYAQHTTEEWVTSKKEVVEGTGIKPTIEVKCEEETCEKDVQLEKAIEVSSSKIGQI